MQSRVALFILFLFPVCGFAQVPAGGGLIVNEINQGTGIKEFIEFLVLGDPSDPCANVNLTGWVFDDNDGSFEACGSGVGIATGHYRFTSCYNAVPPGSLLVVYNAADPYIGMPANDPTDADGDGVYIIPSNSYCLEANYLVPISSPANCTYTGSYASPTLTWASGMANSGDVAQVRKPDYSFFHGFSFGDVNTTFPAWPTGAAVGTSFNKGSGNLALDCGSCWSSANYITTTAGSGTPGSANTTGNGYFISNLQNCTLNYTNLNDVSNCDLLLPVYSFPLNAEMQDQSLLLSWNIIGIEPSMYTVMSSSDGDIFDTLAMFAAENLESFSWRVEEVPSGLVYFKMLVHDIYGDGFTSNIIAAQINPDRPGVFPNPASSTISLVQHPGNKYIEYFIANMQGEIMMTQSDLADASVIKIDISNLPSGQYIIYLPHSNGMDYYPFVH